MTQRWEFPAGVSLDPGNFLVVWCDSDPEDGPLHTSFKLNASGEQCGLYSSIDDGHQLIDSITFGAQVGDISQGRSCDGCGSWIFFQPPTPGVSNAFLSNAPPIQATNLPVVSAYPNPFNPRTTVSFIIDQAQNVELSIFDMTGMRIAMLADQEFQAGTHTMDWQGLDFQGRAVASGTYLLRMVTDQRVVSEKMMLVR